MFALLIALLSALPSAAGTECINIPPDVPKSFRAADLVFAGTLVKNEYQDRLTFRADRIWKGNPAQPDIVLYVPQPAYLGSYVFLEGDRHLFFAHVLSADERDRAAVPREENVAFGIHRACGSPPWSLKLTAELDKIARGRKPPRAKTN